RSVLLFRPRVVHSPGSITTARPTALSSSFVFLTLAVLLTLATDEAVGEGTPLGSTQPVLYPGATPYLLAPRHALVIGVSTLQDSSGFQFLANPRNDALKVSDALKQDGFNVVNLSDS